MRAYNGRVLTAHVRYADGTFETSQSLIEAARALREPNSQIWLDMEEPDEWTLALLGEAFSLHPLAIEDCLHGEQRPRIDPYDGYIFMVLYTPMLSEERDFIGSRELAIFCSSQYIITIHHEPMESLQAIHDRCGRDAENVLGRGMDHLLHMIADRLMDGYQPFLDRLESEAAQLEDEALFDPQDDILERISNIRTEMLQARRYLTPQREALAQLARGEYAFIGKNIRPYFRDVLDHLVRINEDLDLYREQVTSARELFMSAMSQRSNDSIKVFTVIATLMMPPTLVASIYGMNFKLWPPGDHEYAFWIVVGSMAAITGILAWYFRRWEWF
ncbi:MAG TPA: magnesium/cobalt transporter CorA [Phycisphaerae bacterium]|nr:magnesium/cobalt transporter CorA [Phycisphaerae bacterium]